MLKYLRLVHVGGEVLMFFVRLVLLTLAFCFMQPLYTSAQVLIPAEPETVVDYFWSNEKQVRLAVFRDVLAVQGQRSAAQTRSDEFRPGIRSFADEHLPKLAAFDREGFFFVNVAANERQGVGEELSRSGRVQQVGLAAAVVLERVPLEQAPVMVITPEFIVKFKETVNEEQIKDFNQRHNAVSLRSDRFVPRQYVYRSSPPDPSRTLELAATYYMSGLCDLAHPNFVTHRVARGGPVAPPNDKFFGNQWHLENIGQGGGKPGADVRALNVWNITRGSRIS